MNFALSFSSMCLLDRAAFRAVAGSAGCTTFGRRRWFRENRDEAAFTGRVALPRADALVIAS